MEIHPHPLATDQERNSYHLGVLERQSKRMNYPSR